MPPSDFPGPGFWDVPPSAFPGPSSWDVPAYAGRAARGSTGIVQPPMHAVAAWQVYRRAAAHGASCARQAAAELEWLYPRLVNQQEYLVGRRDAGGDGLACMVHPWESGMDNSASWDHAMAGTRAGSPYFHPDTGEGIGAPAFSWTAALALDLLADRSVPSYAAAA